MKPTIDYTDFDKLDFRAGKVIEAEVPEWSKKLIKFTVDFGNQVGKRTIFSGVQKWYTPEDFTGKMFPFVINLDERRMGKGVSQGMMLMVDNSRQPMVTPLPDEIFPGDVIR